MSAAATLRNDPPRVIITERSATTPGPQSTLPLAAATIEAATFALQSNGWQPVTWYPGNADTPGVIAACAVTPTTSARVLMETRVSDLRPGDLWLFDGAWVTLTEVTPAKHPDDRVQIYYFQEGETEPDRETEFFNPRGNEVAVVKREPSSAEAGS